MENNENSLKFFEKILDGVEEEICELKSNSNLPFDVLKSEISSPKFIKMWSRTYGDSTLLDKSLNALAGEVSLSIPLVDVQITPTLSIIYDLTYDQRSKAFKSQFLEDSISVDYQNTVFNEDFSYHLNLRGLKSQFKRTSVVNEFSLDASNVKISFDPLKQQWIIENSSDRVVYGNAAANGAVKHGLAFENWSGSGSDARNLKKIPLTWYIAERHSKLFGTFVYYKYHVTEEKFPASTVNFTSAIRLEEILTSNGEISIKFGYEIASSTEERKFVDAKGNLELNNLMVDNHNLVSMFVETGEYEQVRLYFILF